MDSEFASHAKG